MKGYEYIARALLAHGTDHAFYQEAMFPRMRECYEALGGKTILAHSEFAAGYMADGYARVSGKPGFTYAQSIGAANAAAGIHDAWLGCSPVISVTGRQIPEKRYRNAYQESDHRPFFDGLTKFNATVERAFQLPLLLSQCYREVTTGKPRPAHLDVPGFMGRECEEGEVGTDTVAPGGPFAHYPAFRPAAQQAYIDAAAAEIEKAERPLLLAGRGAVVSRAHEELRAFAAKCDIPVCTSPDGKTILGEDDPLWAGIIGNYGMRGTNEIARRCDLLIIVGSQAGDQTTLDFTAPPTGVKTIQIDIEPSEIGRSYPDCVPLFGDAKTVLAQLAAAVGAGKHTAWRQEAAALLRETTDAQAALWADGSEPVTTGRLCAALTDALPENAILVSDTGWSCVWSATMIRMKSSQLYLRAAGSLGWSLPAAIGAKCAAPDRPVAAFLGDGGAFYYVNEIETAVRYGIPVVWVINNNHCLSQCLPSGVTDSPLAWDPAISFARVAAEYGAWAREVTKVDELGAALREAIACGAPAVVEVRTGRCAPLPPTPRGL